MAWSIEGRYFENCSCEVVCPCTASLALGADNDYCRVILAFHIDSGEVDGVDVSGLSLAAVAQSGRYMHEGNWKLGVLIDDSASENSIGTRSAPSCSPTRPASAAIGPPSCPLNTPASFSACSSSSDGRHTLRLGDLGQASVEDVVPFGVQTGEPAQLTGIFHPVGSQLTIAKGGADSGVKVFGIEFGGGGKAGFSHKFAWSA